MFCREQAARYSAARAEIQARGGDVAFIGNGTAAMAQDFARTDNVTAPLYTDPSRRTYVALGAKRSATALLDPRMLLAGRQAVAAGFTQSATRGDVMQLGAELIVLPGGELRFSHISRFAGDHAEVAKVLTALGSIAPR